MKTNPLKPFAELYPPFQEEVDDCWEIFCSKYPGYTKPVLSIGKYEGIWGCIRPGTNPPDLRLNALLAQAPKVRLRQVIFHEFCHLIHQDHSREFWDDLAYFSTLRDRRRADAEERLRKLKDITDNL